MNFFAVQTLLKYLSNHTENLELISVILLTQVIIYSYHHHSYVEPIWIIHKKLAEKKFQNIKIWFDSTKWPVNPHMNHPKNHLIIK